MAKKLAALAAALVIALGAAIWMGQSGQPGMTQIGATAALAEEAPATAQLPEVAEMVLGNADAPITIVEYASFTCPHCAHFHETVFKDLKKDYIDTGKVKFVYREVFFDRYGLWAAMVARCGGETRYFGINAMLFEQQKTWAGTDDPATAVENLKKIGRTAGMDDADASGLPAGRDDGAGAGRKVRGELGQGRGHGNTDPVHRRRAPFEHELRGTEGDPRREARLR